MRVTLLTIISSMLLSALSLVILFGLCFAIGMLGAGMLGFRIFTAPGFALSPFFSSLTSLLPASFVHALVGTSSVGSSLGLLALWSALSWFILFWIVALIVLGRRALRRRMIAPPSRSSTI
ncbi:MAG: hypothetical protein KGI62_09425 [Xanthomonadaceae bacterium]|nr:hypothetical protein [Xanthomonadaceae bacterium]